RITGARRVGHGPGRWVRRQAGASRRPRSAQRAPRAPPPSLHAAAGGRDHERELAGIPGTLPPGPPHSWGGGLKGSCPPHLWGGGLKGSCPPHSWGGGPKGSCPPHFNGEVARRALVLPIYGEVARRAAGAGATARAT